MNKGSRLISLMVVFAVGLSFHASAALAEGNTLESAAKGFAKAYYMLDESMADFMSSDARVNENDVNMVELFLRLKEEEAENRGYEMSYLKMQPILIKTEVLEKDEDTAVVLVNTTALRSINPLYRVLGYLFGLIREQQFQTTYSLVKEDGLWKVGPGALNLMI